MRFDINASEWVNEIESFLSGDPKKVGDIKKVLKSANLSKLSYDDKVKLSQMFDPTCEVSDEVFKRQLELYFALLESKTAPKTIPMFSDYIEWVYAQDSRHIPDKMFELMTSRLLKAKATELPESVSKFATGLTHEYTREIDKISNTRLNSLVQILNTLGVNYAQMPVECQKFIKSMFIACAVKTEIADKNKQEIRAMFRNDPKGYYSDFNKAFAGFEQHESWIDEPAKKLTLRNMINYANFQEMVIQKCKRGLYFSKFQSCARDLRLSRLPKYDEEEPRFKAAYLPEPREYKDYAKKMINLFLQMVEFEAENFAEKRLKGEPGDIFKFAITRRMATFLEYADKSSNPYESAVRYANALIDFVHLDALAGTTKRQIINLDSLMKNVRPTEAGERVGMLKRTQVEPRVSTEQMVDKLSRQLDELYERYHELRESGKRDYNLESQIIDLETKISEYSEPDQLGDE